ncbi:MAG: hypothetical protein ACOC6F_01825 [bacterium]
MSTSTLTRPVLQDDVTGQPTAAEVVRLGDESVIDASQELGGELFYRRGDEFLATGEIYGALVGKQGSDRTAKSDWQVEAWETRNTRLTVWDTEKMHKLVSSPLGSPVDLTLEEADEIVRLAAGQRPDLEPGKDVIRRLRILLGHSIANRLDRGE